MKPASTLPQMHEIGKDLLDVHPLKRFWVLSRPFFFFVGYILTAAVWNPWVGLPFLLALFISNICAAHDVVHNCLKLSNRMSHCLLSLYGIIVMQSGHSFRITHLSHHRMFPSKEDPEGAASFGTVWEALKMGPFYVPRLWHWAMNRARKHPVEQAWMLWEATLGGLIYLSALLLIPYTLAPIVYVVVMTLGAWLYPLVTAYFPHQHPGDEPVHQARSLHGKIIPWLTLGLGYHLEHHLYPRVPSSNMKMLSERLLPILKEQDADLIRVL